MNLADANALTGIIVSAIIIVSTIIALGGKIRQLRKERLRAREEIVFPLPKDVRFESILVKIKKQLDKGETKQAIQEIEESKRNPSSLDPSAPITSIKELELQDPLALAELLLVQAEGMLKLGDRQVLFVCQGILNLCTSAKVTTTAQIERKEHIRGRAINNIAYFYRVFKNYPRAEQEYRNAIPHLRNSGDRKLYADTLKNLAFVYALQGRLIAAELLCQDAIEIFREQGSKSSMALSVNTLGFVHIERQQHQIGLERCKRALKMFESISDQRGIGISSITLSYCLQRLSGRETYSFDERIRYLEQGERHLNRSVEIFRKSYQEPPRLIAARGALGCIYRDWSRLAKLKGADSSEVEKLQDAALNKLQQSFDGAREGGMLAEQVDILEDMAQVYFDRKETKKSLQLLDEAAALVPAEYYISESGLPDPREPVTPYWATMGKVALLRGHIEYDFGREKDSVYWYMLAGSYFQLFAEPTPLIDYAARSIYNPRLQNSKPALINAWRHSADKIQEQYRLQRTRLMDILDQTLGVIENPD